VVHDLVYAPSDPAREALIAERQEFGLDHHDEVWEGYYVMSPGGNGKHARLQSVLNRCLGNLADAHGLVSVAEINLGDRRDFRVPDGAILAEAADDTVWFDTALVVIEVLSKHDDSFRKFGFYYRKGVEEILIVDPMNDTVQWFSRGTEVFVPAEGSQVLGISGTTLAGQLGFATN
jgi:Uma2 family endonuclease